MLRTLIPHSHACVPTHTRLISFTQFSCVFVIFTCIYITTFISYKYTLHHFYIQRTVYTYIHTQVGHHSLSLSFHTHTHRSVAIFIDTHMCLHFHSHTHRSPFSLCISRLHTQRSASIYSHTHTRTEICLD